MSKKKCELQQLRELLDPRAPVPPLSPAGQARFDLVQEVIASPDPFAALDALEAADDAIARAKADKS